MGGGAERSFAKTIAHRDPQASDGRPRRAGSFPRL